MFKKDSSKLSIEVLEKCAPIVIVDKSALAKMKIYIDECTDEVGWLGTATKEEGFYHITDVFLFDQEVHSTTTEITPEGLSDFAQELLKQDNGMEVWNNMKVWGHSHVNMPNSPSGQDNSQMEVFADNGHDFFIRIIANKKGNMAIDLYDYETGVIYKNITWYANQTEEELDIQERLNELEEEQNMLYVALKTMEENRVELLKPAIVDEMKIKVRKKNAYSNVTTYQGNKITAYNAYVNEKVGITTKKKENEREKSKYEGLQYDEETGTYSYIEPDSTTGYTFNTYGIDDYTLSELSISIDLDDGQEILLLNGYANIVTDIELVKLISDVRNEPSLDYYNNYGGIVQ